MHPSLPLSPLHSGLLVYDLAVTAVWNLLRNAETEDTHSTLRIWHSMLRELSPDMALQQAGKEGSSQRPLFLSLSWFVLLPKSSVVFLTQGGRQLALATRSFAEAAQGIGHQLHKKPAPCMRAEMLGSVLSSNSPSICVPGDKGSPSEGGMSRDVLFNYIRSILAPCTIFGEPYMLPLSYLVLLGSWERYGTWALYNTSAD